ncbi:MULTISPECIES: TM7S3/TM198-like domain-containing protein [Desulfococcus]|uniref:TM7S3/TM198-like domain-containing protein n=1 Tax=Desulfococcus multivorans DSM 2059 TaxID=1121405 RepID=S7VAI4_DESML|nr:DUF4203 domain-containing protein [Desulfococcus multivorans]AOY58625.1 conserved uncharacterized protein [Desulfococcus multivorans]AQV00921.1 DUF4203 domain-containing protein [Desulfococcus multivorans]EPR41523.1 hypothetical protein dsmv_1956 [Desulfococcus multivorans DSM 2059]SJZ44967.1 protein of unknown function [Desulfococcus multivorans DSM 2059]
MVNIPGTVVGIMILFIGRKLFWLFVGSLGLMAGLTYTERFLGPQEEYVILGIAVLIGLLFAVSAFLLKKIAVGVAGFMVGAYVTFYFLKVFGYHETQFVWLICLLGGIVGIALMAFLFDWAIIFLSSVFGAVLVIQSIALEPHITPWAFFGMVILGCAAQAKIMYSEPGMRGRR